MARSSGVAGSLILEQQKLLRPKCLVVDQGGRLDEILEVSTVHQGKNEQSTKHQVYSCSLPSEEIPEVDKLAMAFVLHVNHSPAVLATTDSLSVDNDVSL